MLVTRLIIFNFVYILFLVYIFVQNLLDYIDFNIKNIASKN